MEQEPKKPRVIKVKRMFEPDRIAPTYLQSAYEQVLPSKQYRIVLPEPPGETLGVLQDQKEKANK